MILYTIVAALTLPIFRRVYRVEVTGAERIPPSGGCILAANHDSILDGFFLALATRRQIHFMAKVELFRRPVVKHIVRRLGCFPVERGGDVGEAIDRAAQLLDQGEVIGIFPQATCRPYRDRPFRWGAARLALGTGAPIVPVARIGVERSIQPRSHRIGFPRVKILVGEPLLGEGQKPSRKQAVALTEQLERAIAELRAPYGEPDHVWYEAA